MTTSAETIIKELRASGDVMQDIQADYLEGILDALARHVAGLSDDELRALQERGRRLLQAGPYLSAAQRKRALAGLPPVSERLSARVKAGVATYRRTHRNGAWGTRPLEITKPDVIASIRAALQRGQGIGKTARELGVGTGTVHRVARELRKA